jgi:hypothetical protein
MRLMRTLFCLLPILCACGGVEIVLKSPVESQCGKHGLKGCPDLTAGFILYVKGDKPHGKEKLLLGASANAPAKVKEFAQALRELEKIPGTGSYMKQVYEIIDILASGGGGPAGPGPAGPGPAGPGPAGPPAGGTIASLATSQKVSCGTVGQFGACAWVVAGPVVVTNVAVDPTCPGPVATGVSASGPVLALPRWIMISPHGLPAGQTVQVGPGESLFMGVQSAFVNDPRCTITWTGYR